MVGIWYGVKEGGGWRLREERGKKGVYISDTVGFPSGNVPRIYKLLWMTTFLGFNPPYFPRDLLPNFFSEIRNTPWSNRSPTWYLLRASTDLLRIKNTQERHRPALRIKNTQERLQ